MFTRNVVAKTQNVVAKALATRCAVVVDGIRAVIRSLDSYRLIHRDSGQAWGQSWLQGLWPSRSMAPALKPISVGVMTPLGRGTRRLERRLRG